MGLHELCPLNENDVKEKHDVQLFCTGYGVKIACFLATFGTENND